MKQSLIILYTGNGKGKTTAGFGQLLRALGQNMRVAAIQFIKASTKTGEIIGLQTFGELAEVHVMGSGFTWKAKDQNIVREKAIQGWETAQRYLREGVVDMLLLDEITYPLNYGLLDEEQVIQTIMNRPAGMHLVLTGRNASSRLIEAADLVTEMKEIKHPYKNGIQAQKGIEF